MALRRGQIRSLDAFESFIYEFERGGRSYILRLGHSLRRSEALIQGEVDWINYLAARGVSVAQTILSEAGKLVEAIDDGQGGQFLATAFVKAQGRPLYDAWTPSLYAAFGQLLGSMHALAEQYQPAQPVWKRPEWDDPLMDYPARYLPPSEVVAKQKYQALCAYVRALPKDNRCYGLVHFDAHGGNCLVDEAGRLTLFDFDDCTYSWYANDLAITLGYIAHGAADTSALMQTFTCFLQGYRTAYRLDRSWLREIPVFLKMGEIFGYAVMYRDYGDANQVSDPETKRFMIDLKYKIEHDLPAIDFEFELLAEYL